MKKILYTILFLSVFTGQSQNIHFIKSYGNNGYDFGRDIKQDIDTGYIATGSSSSFTSGNADAFLLKVDSLGNFKWSYNYGGSGSDWGEAVTTTQGGGYAIAGYTNSFGAGGFDAYFIKTDALGVPIVEKTYGGSDWDKFFDMVEMPDNGFIMVGETYSMGEGNNDMYVVRTDPNGDTLWTTTYGGSDEDYANAVLLDGDSIVVVGGTKSFGNGMTDGIILKYHIDGTLGWTKTAGMERDDYFTGIAYHAQTGEYSMSGTRDYNHFQNCTCGNDFWIYKTDATGLNVIDTTRSGPDQLGLDIAYDIVIAEDNKTYFGGSTTSWGTPDISQGYSDAYIGQFLQSYFPTNYVKNFGTTKSDVVYAIENTNDNGKVAIGDMYHSSTGGYNMFIIKIDELNSSGQITVTTELSNELITLAIDNYQDKSDLKIYPTLVNTHIEIENLPLKNIVEVISLNGIVIKSISNCEGQIDFSSVEKGLYIVRVMVEERQYSYKIIRQ